ncbi:hypothetical protein ASG72_18175 [Bosea sp. Leaf344]|uniref:hypothetical protein n=1 Tax=Bosea sp. Leaf344 TaxID=1736346 RepID=UPI0007010756|nr:hypothetical protein [Bosea sp. Leaf344]KQU49943.1 hypothetical protein ASG72_18175 [Bosea sp. Leaf344]
MSSVFLIRLEDCEQLVIEVPGAEDIESEFVEGRALTTLMIELGAAIGEPESDEIIEGERVTTHDVEIRARALQILAEKHFPRDFSGPSQVPRAVKAFGN